MTSAPPRFVRQFALTMGRAHSIGVDLPLDALVVTSPEGRKQIGELRSERLRIAQMCDRPLSIAEVSAHLHLHLGIVRVLISDMCDLRLLGVTTADHPADGPDLATLERLLDDLHSL
jgi:hypothetical protein